MKLNISLIQSNLRQWARFDARRIAADEKYAADKRTNLEACARTLDATCDAVYEPLGSFRSNIGDTIRVEVKASATDVDVDLDNLTVEQARKVLELVKTFATAHEATA